VYDKDKNNPQAALRLWANGTKQQFPVLEGAINQQEMLTDTMRSWLALPWKAAAGWAGKREGLENEAHKRTKPDTDE